MWNSIEFKYLLKVASKEFQLVFNVTNKHLDNIDCKVMITNIINGNPAYLYVNKIWMGKNEGSYQLNSYC